MRVVSAGKRRRQREGGAGVTHDADDLPGLVSQLERLAERLRRRPGRASHRFIHNDDARVIRLVSIGEGPAAQKWSAHRFEESRANPIDTHGAQRSRTGCEVRPRVQDDLGAGHGQGDRLRHAHSHQRRTSAVGRLPPSSALSETTCTRIAETSVLPRMIIWKRSKPCEPGTKMCSGGIAALLKGQQLSPAVFAPFH